MQSSVWHLLQISDVLDIELASALAEIVPVIGWKPQRTLLPWRVRAGAELENQLSGSSLRIRSLPLLRGFARLPVSTFFDVSHSIVKRLLQQTPDPQNAPLICTAPYFAPVAELWPGPVVYWLTDLMAEYAGADRNQVIRLDRRLCAVADLICPNSHRIQDYLIQHADAEASKILIIPNATRHSNVLAHPAVRQGIRPASIAHVKGHIAGVIGNLAGNMDWLFLRTLIDAVPEFQWVFVGPTSMEIPQKEQRRARAAVMAHPRAHFVGRQAYSDLAAYARSFDLAVLPYRLCEPTYSGSSTRFYEHLAACRPMIATAGLEELTRKPPLLYLTNTTSEATAAMRQLAAQDFDDGFAEARWLASLNSTWEVRARSIHTALQKSMAASRKRTTMADRSRQGGILS